MNKITVIGAGNGGVTAAYNFTKLGNNVCLYDQFEFSTHLDAIKNNNGIEALEVLNDVDLIMSGFEKIDLVTNDIKEALEYTNVLVMIVPSFAQEILYKKMLPYLNNNHILISMPGNYASLVMDNIRKNSIYADLDMTYVDAISIPWACRLSTPGSVAIMGIKEFLYAGVYPQNRTERVLDIINSLFPIEVKKLNNVIEAGLENINFGGHPLVTTLNIGLLENFNGEFNYYCDCVSPSTDKASAKMEEERINVGASMGLKLTPELEMMNALYNTNSKSVYEFNKTSVTHGKIHSAPNSAKSRYITEDVPNILIPVYEFSKIMGLESPIIESCIRIASVYNDTDYFKEGRTLEKMGLKDMSIDEIMVYVNKG